MTNASQWPILSENITSTYVLLCSSMLCSLPVFIINARFLQPRSRVLWLIYPYWRIAMSLFSMNGMPASTSLSRFSTTSPSKYSLWLSRTKVSLVSPITLRGDEPSAWWADWELRVISALWYVAVEARIMFPVALLSMVHLTGWCPRYTVYVKHRWK